MFTLLRKIRRSLLGSGNTRRYMLYALGEIVLVVVGILIALQINNWNQERITKKAEENVLLKLYMDLQADYDRFMSMDSNYQYQLDYQMEMKVLFRKDQNSVEEVRKMMDYDGVSHQDINPRKSAFEGMVNSGSIYNLSNVELLEEIMAYYQEIDNSIYHIRQDRNEFRANIYSPLATNYWSFFTDEPGIKEKQAVEFFRHRETQAFKILKQASGWSVLIINNQRYHLDKLRKQNRRLSENIDRYLKEEE